jgi:hypothetical protein
VNEKIIEIYNELDQKMQQLNQPPISDGTITGGAVT